MQSLPRPIPDSYWVLPGRFLAGEYPGAWDDERTRHRLDAFLQAGFNAFLDLTRPHELPPYLPLLNERARARGVDVLYQRFPIGDFGVPTPRAMRRTLDAIDAALAAGRTVYLHCWGGVGRTGTTVACYLIRHGKSGPQALQQVAEWWKEVPKSLSYPRSPETTRQVQFVLDWDESLCAGD